MRLKFNRMVGRKLKWLNPFLYLDGLLRKGCR